MRLNERHSRRYQRYKTDAKVRVRVYLDEYLTTTMNGRCCELARGGLGAQLPDQLRVGDSVLIEMARAVSAYATVRFVNGFYHGFEFTLVRENARGYIDKVCEQHAREMEAMTARAAAAATPA